MTIQKILTALFGSRNDRLLKRYRSVVEQINALEPKISALTDEQLRARTQELRDGIKHGRIRGTDIMHEAFAIIRESMDRHIGIRTIFNPEENFNPDNYEKDQFSDEAYELYDQVQQRMIQTGESWQTVSIPVKLYEAVRKLFPDSRPPFRARCFDVQLIGGVVLYEGKIAEMATGEGKTFVAPLACFMRAVEGNHCHVVTVNDYLVRRDATWVRPAFENLGISVGFIQADMDPGSESRKKMYECDVTYGTNSEFGFDYLRDNMKERADLQVQGSLDYAIVDEVDSILIDEARTPLIISGAARDDAPKYRDADRVARKMVELNGAWSEVERQVDAAKRAIKAAEGDVDKAEGDKKLIEAAQKRREEGEQALIEGLGRMFIGASGDRVQELCKKHIVSDRVRSGAIDRANELARAGETAPIQYYETEPDRKSVHLTHEGIEAAQEEAGVGSFYVGTNVEWPHLMEQALRAHVVYVRDKDYVIDRGRSGEMEIVIVDEYTGRKMVGRQWSEGLHQAIEAKERVPIKQETQTLATITLQNFFKLYRQIAGMTGTAQTEAEEFGKIYKLEVVTIPTNRQCVRADNEDKVYRKQREKWEALLEEIKRYSDAGRPVLVGTTSVEKSEMLSMMLKRKYGVEHEVLNAKQHEREALIVLKAGQSHVNAHGERVGNVTIATNMAGRGTDIKLAPETLFDVEKDPASAEEFKLVAVQRTTGKRIPFDNSSDSPYYTPPGVNWSGGLHVIGTERHTARRIDNQLRGRGGRQGDPGSSRFFVSLEDELMSMFAGEWTIKVLGWLGMKEGEAIEDKRITKGIVRAQKKVEERNFLARKNLLEYDEVMDFQRGGFYGMRQQVLEGRDIDKVIWGMIGESIEDAVEKYIVNDYVAACCCDWGRTNFNLTNLDPEDYRGLRTMLDLENFIKNQAKTELESIVDSTLTEFMGEDPSEREWDTRGLSSWAMSQFQVNLSQAQLKKMEPEEVAETLKAAATDAIDKRDCAGLAKYLQPLYAETELAAWAKEKFGIGIDPKAMMADLERKVRKSAAEIIAMIDKEGRAVYARREIEYPVDHLLNLVYGGADTFVDDPYRADYVRGWVFMKYRVELPLEDVRIHPRRLRDRLIGLQEQYLHDGKIEQEVDAILAKIKDDGELAKVFNERFGTSYSAEDIDKVKNPVVAQPQKLDRDARGKSHTPKPAEDGPPPSLRDTLLRAARGFLRQELTMLEQFVMIQIFDTSWKDHLYAMDMLRTGVGLQAFAEKDPRTVYKREGYRYFNEMMQGIRAKVTDLIFRARIQGQAEQRSAYNVTAATHEDAGGYGVGENVVATSKMLAEQQPQPEGEGRPQGEAAAVVKPIVREAPKVGRNDPCPCGSGKKYKKCCGVNAE